MNTYDNGLAPDDIQQFVEARFINEQIACRICIFAKQQRDLDQKPMRDENGHIIMVCTLGDPCPLLGSTKAGGKP